MDQSLVQKKIIKFDIGVNMYIKGGWHAVVQKFTYFRFCYQNNYTNMLLCYLLFERDVNLGQWLSRKKLYQWIWLQKLHFSLLEVSPCTLHCNINILFV